MFGKEKQKKEWKPEIPFDGKNIVVIDFFHVETLDYLIGQGYKVIAFGMSSILNARIYLQKPEGATKVMKGDS